MAGLTKAAAKLPVVQAAERFALQIPGAFPLKPAEAEALVFAAAKQGGAVLDDVAHFSYGLGETGVGGVIKGDLQAVSGVKSLIDDLNLEAARWESVIVGPNGNSLPVHIGLPIEYARQAGTRLAAAADEVGGKIVGLKVRDWGDGTGSLFGTVIGKADDSFEALIPFRKAERALGPQLWLEAAATRPEGTLQRLAQSAANLYPA